MGFDPDELMRELAKNNPKVLFYPSSGFRHENLFDMDYNLFILSDYYPRTCEERKRCFKKMRESDPHLKLYESTVHSRICKRGDKWVFLFFQDNNDVFERIKKADLKISCFVGVNDGCREGGNYECVNSSKWMRKVFDILSDDGGKYITDHSSLAYPDGSAYLTARPFSEFVLGKWRLRERIDKKFIPFRPFYSKYLVCYNISLHHPDRYIWHSSQGITLTLEYDDIVNHIDKLDGLIISGACWLSFRPSDEMRQKIIRKKVITISRWKGDIASSRTEKILKEAKKNKWDTVGTIAYGNGIHEGILQVLDSWKDTYPKQIRIFYLYPNDFNDIKPKFKKI